MIERRPDDDKEHSKKAKNRSSVTEKSATRYEGPPEGESLLQNPSLLADPQLRRSENTATRAAAYSKAQSTYGNHAVQRSVKQGKAKPTREEGDEDGELAKRIEAAQEKGERLDSWLRGHLEKRLGGDLSGVRIHRDAEADGMVRSVDADAFASGRHVFFRAGAYEPDTRSGLHLLAHELTHTIQQASGPVDGSAHEGGVNVSDPSDRFEQEAEQTAWAVISGDRGPGSIQGTGDKGSGAAAGPATSGAVAGTPVQRGKRVVGINDDGSPIFEDDGIPDREQMRARPGPSPLPQVNPNQVMMMTGQGTVGETYERGTGPRSSAPAFMDSDFGMSSILEAASRPAQPRQRNLNIQGLPAVQMPGNTGNVAAGRRGGAMSSIINLASAPNLSASTSRRGPAPSISSPLAQEFTVPLSQEAPAPDLVSEALAMAAPESTAPESVASPQPVQSAAPEAPSRPARPSYLDDVITPQQDLEQRRQLDAARRGPRSAPAIVSNSSDVATVTGGAQPIVEGGNRLLRGQNAQLPPTASSALRVMSSAPAGIAGAGLSAVKAAYEPTAPNLIDAGMGAASVIPAVAGSLGRLVPAYSVASAAITAANWGIGGYNWATGRQGQNKVQSLTTPSELIASAPERMMRGMEAVENDPVAKRVMEQGQEFMGVD